jgi:hypothetical protein
VIDDDSWELNESKSRFARMMIGSVINLFDFFPDEDLRFALTHENRLVTLGTAFCLVHCDCLIFTFFSLLYHTPQGNAIHPSRFQDFVFIFQESSKITKTDLPDGFEITNPPG